jgi:lysophospholipase L1-like esterase
VWPRWQSLSDVLHPPLESYQHEIVSNYFENRGAWADFVTGLDRLAEIQARHQFCVIVFLHTHLYYLNWLHPFRAIYDRVERAAEDRGLVTIESFDVHRGRRAEELWTNAFNPHPNAAGHQVLARALFDGLKDLPGDCWH